MNKKIVSTDRWKTAALVAASLVLGVTTAFAQDELSVETVLERMSGTYQSIESLGAELHQVKSYPQLGLTDPATDPWMVAVIALLVTFFSASQDIVVDAYRREDLSNAELGLGSSLYINGYRVGMLLASGGGLILADHWPFSVVYLIMALCLLPGVVTTVLTPEPEAVAGTPQSLKEAAIMPLAEYFSRHGAFWILGFILFYKIGDSMATNHNLYLFS